MGVTSLEILAPPPDALEPDERWVAAVRPAEMRKAIEIFVQYHNASIATGCPLERWLRVLDEADYSERKQTQFISTLAEADQRKAHDLIEARRLAWSVAAF